MGSNLALSPLAITMGYAAKRGPFLLPEARPASRCAQLEYEFRTAYYPACVSMRGVPHYPHQPA